MQGSLHTLHQADGSAIYHCASGHTVLAAVNGPVDVQRRHELPEEAYIEINVCPHDGVGQIKERHLESIIAKTLSDVVLTQMFPRQMVQLTFQVLEMAVDDKAIGRMNPQAQSYLFLLSTLLNAACIALLDSGIPLRCTFSSITSASMRDNSVKMAPSTADLEEVRSLHVFTFSSKNDLLLAESEGDFTLEDWTCAEELAKNRCLGNVNAMVEADGDKPILGQLHSTMIDKIVAEGSLRKE